MATRLTNETNTDRIASKDRGVAGRQPDGTSASGGSSPTGGGGGQAALPLLTDAGSPDIRVNKPGASASYSVTYSVGAAPAVVATLFPFTISMGSASTALTIYASESGQANSPTLVTSWNDLFL